MDTKEKLVNDKAALELLLSENGDQCIDYKAQLSVVNQKLEDMGKPEVTPMFLDALHETILEVVENIDLDDALEVSLDMDYDNRVSLDSVNFADSHAIAEKIYDEVEKLFVEAECPEE